jgi:hypothetical protein
VQDEYQSPSRLPSAHLGIRAFTFSSPQLPQLKLPYSVPTLIDWLASHSREVRARRVSVSSTEENLDLEAALASLRVPPGHSFPDPVPEGEEPLPEPSIGRSGIGKSLGRSRSPTDRARGFASRLRSSIASLGSPHTPVSGNGETIWTSKKNFATDTQLLFKRRITNLYVQVSALRSYVELNYSGFRKVLKKYAIFCTAVVSLTHLCRYDKVTESSV